MRRLAALALLALAAACSDDPCQELGEKICSCIPGTNKDGCKAQTEQQLESASLSDGECDALLATCNAVPPGAEFCEWLLTADGKKACGLTP